MSFPTPVPPPTPSLWPKTKTGVLDIAQAWFDPRLVNIDDQVIAQLNWPVVEPGADITMAAGSFGRDWLSAVEKSLALNSINYQFWDLDEQGSFVRYIHEGQIGALAMRAAFEKAWDDPQSPLNKARAGTPLTPADVVAMFGSIPAIASRVTILNEMLLPRPSDPNPLATVAAEVVNALDSGLACDAGMAHDLAVAFPTAYGDEVLKKAQLAISEVWVSAQSRGCHVPCDLTAFADYQIPNILRALGVLTYHPELAAHIDAYKPLPANSHQERALRAASILAVEKIAITMGVPVAAVDHWLWTRRREATTPFHLTHTTAY